MNIIQHGRKSSETEKICTIYCDCGCRFQFGNKDPLIEEQWDKWDNIYRFIRCPDCGNRFRLKPAFFLE